MSDTKVIDTKLALAWMLPLCFTIISSLGALIWMAAQQSSAIASVVKAQEDMKAQMSARDIRDDAYRSTQAAAVNRIELSDSRQELRLESLEKWRNQIQSPPLGR